MYVFWTWKDENSRAIQVQFLPKQRVASNILFENESKWSQNQRILKGELEWRMIADDSLATWKKKCFSKSCDAGL